MERYLRHYLTIAGLAIYGCTAGSGEGLDMSGRPLSETPDPTDQPTLANIQARIFTPICVQCHVGAGAPQGLRLDSSNSFGDLVGIPSREVSSLNRVEPFDPDRSYLFQKIQGTAAVGDRMPLGGPALPDEDIELVRQWIADGAMPTPVADNSKVGRMISASSDVEEAILLIRMTNSTALDSSSVLATSFRLTTSDDPVFGNSDDRQVREFSAQVAPGHSYGVILRVGSLPPDAVRLKVTLGNDTPTRLLDLSGYPIQTYAVEFDLESGR